MDFKKKNDSDMNVVVTMTGVEDEGRLW